MHKRCTFLQRCTSPFWAKGRYSSPFCQKKPKGGKVLSNTLSMCIGWITGDCIWKMDMHCDADLAMQEAKLHFGTVDHPSIVLDVDAALLPASWWVIGEGGVPFDVFNCLKILGWHLLSKDVHGTFRENSSMVVILINMLVERVSLTFLGVTVHKMLMMLLDFTWPSWGFFLRNSRRLLFRGKRRQTLMRALCQSRVYLCNILVPNGRKTD